ncbi:uncharacterized protein K460DRAFT_53542 [Cucurbitaria berberidis CBS 394.84]|uniref:Uncharacterized protein n=1 Tax=Cucurbitaria berberidis CBS 394.84 TaxID=1168544 RepID=A0A9P4GL62_9PLEO|nr:uncharacterized protein K460DRAFT_53542 [Cucurbitaria berberidis CBS 394.84]KAF1847106.1 hypothetical protein K460DRAFT_53542 [Cucurbitaria berberidis CBS 394.84]
MAPNEHGICAIPASQMCSGASEAPRGELSVIDRARAAQERWREQPLPTVLERELQVEILMANFEVISSTERFPEISIMYQALFHRTKTFTTTVRALANATAAQAPQHWAGAGCLLVDWTVNVFRHEKIGIERFLHSQRVSLYWMLDETLLHILLDQWENDSSRIPWDKATAPICLALSKADNMVPGWLERDADEFRKWHDSMDRTMELKKNVLVQDYFKRSRTFLHQSTRINEIWRTVRMCGKGFLPAELANAIVEDVSRSEKLPMGNLRTLYFPKGKGQL